MARQRSLDVTEGMLPEAVTAGGYSNLPRRIPAMVPIETPLSFSGFYPSTLETLAPTFEQMGLSVVQGGASGDLASTKPAEDWQTSLRPGDVVAGVLVSGDLNVTGLGTVTYNDGKRILAFGHSVLQPGPGRHAHEPGRGADGPLLEVPAEQVSPTPPRSSARCGRTATAASWVCSANRLRRFR